MCTVNDMVVLKYLDRGAQGVMEAFRSLIIGALLDRFRFDGQSTSILTIGPSLTDIARQERTAVRVANRGEVSGRKLLRDGHQTDGTTAITREFLGTWGSSGDDNNEQHKPDTRYDAVRYSKDGGRWQRVRGCVSMSPLL